MTTVAKTERKSWTESAASVITQDPGKQKEIQLMISLLHRNGIIPEKAKNDPASVALFFNKCDRLELKPQDGHMYMVPFNSKVDDGQGGKKWVTKFAHVMGVQGMRTLAGRSGIYAGSDDYLFDGNKTLYEFLQGCENDLCSPRTATSTVYKVVSGVRVPFTRSVAWEHFYPEMQYGKQRRKGKESEMPTHMLGKCAEAQALRVAFPAELSGIYLKEEFEHTEARKVMDAEAEVVEDGKSLEDALEQVRGAGLIDIQSVWDDNAKWHDNSQFLEEWTNQAAYLDQVEKEGM